MKKIFSLFAAVLFAGSMMAEPIVVNATDVEGIESGTTGDFEVTVNGIGLAWSGAYYNNDNNQDIRVYASKTLTLTAESNISKVEIVGFAKKDLAMTVSAGEITAGASYTADATKSDWEDPLLVVENIDAAVLTITCNKQMRAFAIRLTFDGEVPPVVADTYTVAGNDAAIFGEAWNPALEANDMKKVGGIYTWEKAGLELTPNDKIEFKVAKNHSWDIAFPASNFEISADEEGVYLLTITFDPATEKVEAVLEGAVVSTDPTNCAEAREAALSVSADNELYNDGKEYTIEGYVTSIQTAYSDQFHNVSFWIADTQDGGNVIQAFRAACENADAAPEVGDKVQVTGSLTKYGTTPEFAQGCTFVIVEKGQLPDPVNLGEKTIAEFLELKNQRDTCILTGAIANVKNDQYGNFDLVDETGSVYVYGLLNAAGESKKCFQEEGLAEGDILTVLAIYGEYNQNPQVKNAIFVSVEKQQGQGIEETATDAKAVKVVRNGQVYILRGDKTFNLIGAEVK